VVASQPAVPAEVLAEVAAGGATDAGGLSASLLGDFLEVLSTAVVVGRPITAEQLGAYESLGGGAAHDGVALRALLDLYLSAAWRLWRHLPPVVAARADPDGVVVAGEVMLHAVDDVVAALTEGYQLARRTLVRAQESARREFIEDLLAGTAGVVSVLDRAFRFGLDLSGPHAVAVISAEQSFTDTTPLIGTLERAIQGSKGDAQPLLASKEGRVVVVFPAPDRAALDYVLEQLSTVLGRQKGIGRWQIGVGRPAIGADGIVASYRQARESLDLAAALGLDTAVTDARDLLVYQVLLRDRAALDELVEGVLTPLLAARGGPEPLLATLLAYFGTGGNAAQTARALHPSGR
jgi:hypothetical protein